MQYPNSVWFKISFTTYTTCHESDVAKITRSPTWWICGKTTWIFDQKFKFSEIFDFYRVFRFWIINPSKGFQSIKLTICLKDVEDWGCWRFILETSRAEWNPLPIIKVRWTVLDLVLQHHWKEKLSTVPWSTLNKWFPEYSTL